MSGSTVGTATLTYYLTGNSNPFTVTNIDVIIPTVVYLSTCEILFNTYDSNFPNILIPNSNDEYSPGIMWSCFCSINTTTNVNTNPTTTNVITILPDQFNIITFSSSSNISVIPTNPSITLNITSNTVTLNSTTYNINVGNYTFKKYTNPVLDNTQISFTYDPPAAPATPPPASVFSQAALNQAATTKTQTTAFLTAIDPGNVLTYDQRIQIAAQVGTIAAHSVSVGECVQKISDTVTQNF
jgi:hypothetical protein